MMLNQILVQNIFGKGNAIQAVNIKESKQNTQNSQPKLIENFVPIHWSVTGFSVTQSFPIQIWIACAVQRYGNWKTYIIEMMSSFTAMPRGILMSFSATKISVGVLIHQLVMWNPELFIGIWQGTWAATNQPLLEGNICGDAKVDSTVDAFHRPNCPNMDYCGSKMRI